jgi:hypothetical protein
MQAGRWSAFFYPEGIKAFSPGVARDELPWVNIKQINYREAVESMTNAPIARKNFGSRDVWG